MTLPEKDDKQGGNPPATEKGETKTRTDSDKINGALERRRSAVRIWVTYIVTVAYAVAALYLIYWFTAGSIFVGEQILAELIPKGIPAGEAGTNGKIVAKAISEAVAEAVDQRTDLAVAVFAGLSSVATGVIGFWFGNRKAKQEMAAGGVGTD